MRCDDVRTKAEIMKKYDIKETMMNELTNECELGKYCGAIIRITGHTYWIHENLWVEFLEDKAAKYHQQKYGRIRRGA